MDLYLIFFIIYIIIVFAIGIISSRKESEDGFMIAERKVSGIQVAATMSAGFFDGATLSVYMAYIYAYGLSAIWAFIGLALGFLLIRKYALKIKRQADKLKVYSMPEYFYKILGKRNGLMFSFFLILQFFLLLTVNLIVSGKVLSSIFLIDYRWGVAIGAAIILSYLFLAGFKAVVKTDFFQLILMFAMTGTITLLFLDKTRQIPMSDLQMGTMGLGNIIGFVIIAGFGLLVAPDLWQRIIATKDEKNLKRGFFFSSIIIILLGILLSIVGLVTKLQLPNIAPEDALVAGFQNLLPAWFVAAGMVLLYAVALSSSDTVAFVVSSILTRDLKNYSKKHSEDSMKRLTRIFLLMFVLLAVLLSIFYKNILQLGFSFASLNLALFPVVLGSLYWKLKEKAVFWSLVVSFISVIILFFTSSLTPETAILVLPVSALALLVFQFTFKKEYALKSKI